MILLSPMPSPPPAGRWNLPEEFVHPDYTTLMSANAQQILESRGLYGYGAARAPYGWRRGGTTKWPWARVITSGPALRGYGATWDEFANRLVIPPGGGVAL
jgi:hypothetical protein